MQNPSNCEKSKKIRCGIPKNDCEIAIDGRGVFTSIVVVIVSRQYCLCRFVMSVFKADLYA